MVPVTGNTRVNCCSRSMRITPHKKLMSQGNTSLLNCKKMKVLTIVGAFFVTPKMLSALDSNHCPHCAGMPQLSLCMYVNPGLLLRKTLYKGVSMLRIRKSCFKSKNEIENLHGFSWKTEALRTASINQNRRAVSKYPVCW